jgi:hypothetical protein
MTSPANRTPCLRRWLAGGAVACAFASASNARAEEPTLDEVRYHPTELPPDGTRSRLLLTGVALTAGWYGVAVGTSYLWPDAPNARDLRIPIAGPWMALGGVRCGTEESNCTDAVLILRTVVGVLSGVGQAGGLFAIAEGLFLDTGSTPKAGASSSSRRAPGEIDSRKQQAAWAAVPVVLPDGAGIELVGRF